MADFRKWLFAIAVVALLAGFSVPVRAQQGPAFNCQATVGVPPIIRSEGLTELVGDVTLDCTGGISTPAGKAVPPVDITIFLSQNVTSKITASLGSVNFDEALLVVDEPHSGAHPTIPLLNCGNTLAPDTGNSGPGVCSIISDGIPTDTYNGSGGVYVSGAPGSSTPCDGAEETSDPAVGTYGCGRPNVFQGRQGSFLQNFPNSSVTFAGVPIDPPGSVGHRIIRITNVRVNATGQGNVSGSPSPIYLTIAINGNTSMGINNPLQTVAYVEPGLNCPEFGTNCTSGTANGNFLQCEPPEDGAAPTSVSINFQEGFLSSWKARNISFIDSQGDGVTAGNGQIQPGNSYWSWSGSYHIPSDVNQNVPGAIYNTESGLTYPTGTPVSGGLTGNDPNPNPPNGIGTVQLTSAIGHPFSNAYNGGNGTNISAAGTVTQGTRLIMVLNTVPLNTQVYVPARVTLVNTAGNNSGAMVLLNSSTNPPNANGAGGSFDNVGGTVQVFQNTVIVYEVIFADPFSLESASVPFFVNYNNNPATLAQTGVFANVSTSGFAPEYASGGNTAVSTSVLPIPRFIPVKNPNYPNGINLFEISKCTCNILFPFVTSGGAANFDTGIAIANTSKDPGAAAYGAGNGAGPQTGTVTLWMYGSNSSGADASALGSQTTSVNVPAGQALLYTFSAGGGQIGGGTGANLTAAGLDNRWAGYTGYVIAQTQFQYCHAFAFISQVGLAAGVSDGYLGLVLDNNGINCGGENQGAPGVDNLGLCRTNQEGENLVH